jgi:hypothetical protein
MSFFSKPEDTSPQEPVPQPEEPTTANSTGSPIPEPIAAEPTASGPMKTVEQWAALKGTPDWAFGAAKAGNGWGTGRELTEAQYDAQLEKATGMLMTAGNPF